VKPMSFLSRLLLVAATFLLLATSVAPADAAEVDVMISGGFSAALRDLAPVFKQATGDTIVMISGPSMGNTPQAIPARLARGESADVVIMVGYALNALVKQGRVVPGSRVDLARSRIAMAVRAGAPVPDISTVDAFKSTLLAAKSIAYSDSASGVYLSTELFPRLGIADQLKPKSTMIPAEPVGAVVARGDAAIGFQQLSELLPVPGIQIVGLLPAEVQRTTTFSGGIVSGAQHLAAAKALLAFLATPTAAAAVAKSRHGADHGRDDGFAHRVSAGGTRPLRSTPRRAGRQFARRAILVGEGRFRKGDRRAGGSRAGTRAPARCPRRLRLLRKLGADHRRRCQGRMGRHVRPRGC